MSFKLLKTTVSLLTLVTFLATNSIYASSDLKPNITKTSFSANLRVPLLSTRSVPAAVPTATGPMVFSLFEAKPGFKNGVFVSGRSKQEIERDIIQNVLNLRILGEEPEDYIKVTGLLPRHWAYQPGLYAHGEMKRPNPFWENYERYLLGQVVENELMLFGLQKAEVDKGVEIDNNKAEEKITGYKDSQVIEDLEKRIREKISKLKPDSIKNRLEGIGDKELKNICGIERKRIYEEESLVRDSLLEIEIGRLKGYAAKERKEKLISFEKEEIADKYARQFSSRNIGRVKDAVKAVLGWEPSVLGHSIREDLTNLYALDVVRTVMKAVLLSDPKALTFNPYRKTNAIANETAMDIANRETADRMHYVLREEIKRLMKLAIGGGVIDLNNPELRADYEQDKDYFMERHFTEASSAKLASQYFDEDFERFYRDVVESKDKVRLVYFLDNNGEAVFDLIFMQELLKSNPNLSIYVVPKILTLGNDISYSEVNDILIKSANSTLFKFLKRCSGKSFHIVKEGPQIQGVDGKRISKELADVLQGRPDEKVIGVFAGQANFETTQGWNIPRYYKLMAKGAGMSMATGLSQKTQAFIFAYVPAGVTVGTGDSYLFEKTGPDKKISYSCRQTLMDFEESIHSERYKSLINGYWNEEEVNERIMKKASETGRTFAEVVFDYDAELYEGLIRLGLLDRIDDANLRKGLIEEKVWGKDGRKSKFREDVERFAGIEDLAEAQRIPDKKEAESRKSKFREDVERFAGIEDLAEAQRIPDKKEAEKRAYKYLCAIAIRTVEEIGKTWEQMNQEEFNRTFGSAQFIAVGGKGSRFSNLVHKGLFIGSQGEPNLRLAINGSYKTPGAKPTIFISMHQLRGIVKDEFIPGLVREVERLGDSPELPAGWSEGILPEDKVDPEKRKKYFTEDALIVLIKPYGPGYYLGKGMEILEEKGLRDKTAYKQIVFGEMGTVHDLKKSNASLITYMEAVIGNCLIAAGGKKAGRIKKGGFEIVKKGNFFLRDGKLVALTDWDYIEKGIQGKLQELGEKLKNWLVLPGKERKKLRDEFAIDSEGNILINSNTVIFSNDIAEYFGEYSKRGDRAKDKKTGLHLDLAWDFIKLVTDALEQKRFKGQWPIGFVDVGDAPSSIKDMAKQTQFSNQYRAQMIERLRDILDDKSSEANPTNVAEDTSPAIYLGGKADFNLSDLRNIFLGKAKISGNVHLDSRARIGRDAQLSNGVRLSGEVKVGDGVTISKAVIEGPVEIESGCILNGTIVCQGSEKITGNITGLMKPEKRLAKTLLTQSLPGARAEIDRAINKKRHTSLAAALTYILGTNDKSTKRAQVLLEYLSKKGLNDYGEVLRKMIVIAPVLDKQSQVFDMIMSISSNTKMPNHQDIGEFNHGVIVGAIDEQLFDFGKLIGSSRTSELYGSIYRDEWTRSQGKTIEFFAKMFDAPGIDIDKKREIMVELIDRYSIASDDMKEIYRATFNKDLIEDIVENWGNKSVEKLVNVLIGMEASSSLDRKLKEEGILEAKKELRKYLELVLNNEAYQELLAIFGNVRGVINSFADIAIKNTSQSFEEVMLPKVNPLYRKTSVYEKPRILGIMGGSGGTPTLLMENLLREVFGEDATMAVVGSPHDDGGSSRKAQDQLQEAGWGYIPPPGDPMNVLSCLTIKEGDTLEAKRNVIRTRFPKDLPKDTSFREEMLKILKNETDTLIRKGLANAPIDWIYFVRYALDAAEALDRELVKPGRLALAGGSVGNFIFIGHHVKQKAITNAGRLREDMFNDSMEKLAQNLGLSNNFLLPSTLDPATLYARLEAFELLVGGKSVRCKVEDENGKKKSTELLFPQMKAELQAGGEPVVTKVGTKMIKLSKDKDSLLTCQINGVRSRIIEDFGEIISRENSKTTVDLTWDPTEKKQDIFKVEQGNFIAECSIKEGKLHFKLIEKIKVGKDEYKFEEISNNYIEYGSEFKVGKPGDYLTARIKIADKKDNENGYQVNVRLDTKGQGTKIYFKDTPVVFRNRLIIEQTNITESVHASGIIDTGFIDGAKPTPNKKVLDLIRNTQEAIVLGPGSLVTSTLSVLMVPQIVDEICKRKKEGLPVMFIVNPYKDNETVDITIMRLAGIIEKVTGRKIEDLFTHMIINDQTKIPNGMTKLEMDKFMNGLTEEDLAKARSETRESSDFSSLAKKPRGPMIVTEEELRELMGRVKILVEPLAKKDEHEVRQEGKAGKEVGIGYDAKKLGQSIEYIIVEKQLARIKELDLYKKLLESYYQYSDDKGQVQKDEKSLEYDIRRLLRKESWIFKSDGIMRTPLEVLSEIQSKRKEIGSAYITNGEIAKHPPKIIIANLAHTLLEYRPASLEHPMPVFKVSPVMAFGINQYLKSGGILIVQSALKTEEMERELIAQLDKKWVHRVILAPYAGTRIYRFDEYGNLKSEPEKDYSGIITDEQRKLWVQICSEAYKIYELDRYLYGPDGPIDGPIVMNNRDGLLINFELENRTDLPEQVVAELNQKFKKKDRPDLIIPKIEKIGVLNDIRDAIVEYLTKRFGDEKLPVVAEKPFGSGAINTRLKNVDRRKVIREIIGMLNREQVSAGESMYKDGDIYILGKGNEVVLEEFPGAQGVYFREEPTESIPDNVRIYHGIYGIHGVEDFFIKMHELRRKDFREEAVNKPKKPRPRLTPLQKELGTGL